MSIKSSGSFKISNLRSKTFKASSPQQLDSELNAWFSTNAERDIISMDTHGNEYFCWVVIVYRE
mgnify:CR=1 FL=1